MLLLLLLLLLLLQRGVARNTNMESVDEVPAKPSLKFRKKERERTMRRHEREREREREGEGEGERMEAVRLDVISAIKKKNLR